MDNLFDLATPAELADLFGSAKSPGDVRLYDTERRLMADDQDYHLDCLASVYAMRGDLKAAERYARQIKGDERRMTAFLSLFELQAV